MTGDAVHLVREGERVLLEANPVARLGRQPLRLFRLGVHDINRTSGGHSLPNARRAVAIPR